MRVSGRETLLARNARPSEAMTWALERSSLAHWLYVATSQGHMYAYALHTPSFPQSVCCGRQPLLVPISV
jgi:hypothetical protein